jgi:uncharacterized spore protein YtfJ
MIELKTPSIGDVKKKTSIGGAIKVGDRTIYPIIELSTLNGDKMRFFGAWISPFALVIVEPTQAYAISLTSETITLDQLIKKVPSLKRKIKL